ncbi:OsmC family protein [Streptomyces sp. NBC_00203]|uniref:OsmC family protein n=1 Tax=Streptomyces sp. NBC_00203 TaxID=2975680 RepID=UPI003251E3B5
MRNGLNITGVSETVHELREHPEEAIADFAVAASARTDDHGVFRARAQTLRAGTIRVARDFRLKQRSFTAEAAGGPTPHGSDTDGIPTPYESALAALGACVLMTKVNGYTARGVTLGALRVTVRADLALDADGKPAAGAPLSRLAWHCALDGDTSTDTVASINRLVTAFSPNHRVFLDKSPITVGARVERGDGTTVDVSVPWTPAAAETAAVCPVEADVVWENGSEAVYRTALTVNGVRRQSAPLVADQPKQLVGIDKGPNSQEILLSALCGELAALLEEEAAADGTELHDPVLRADGRIDTRGMLNVHREISSSFHNLAIRLTARSDAPEARLRGLLSRALSRAVLPATLLAERAITVTVAHGDEPQLTYHSTVEDAEGIRDEVTRRQREAAAS